MKKEESKEAKKIKAVNELSDNMVEKVSGGSLSYARTCRECGGIISVDPNISDEFKCHCNEEYSAWRLR